MTIKQKNTATEVPFPNFIHTNHPNPSVSHFWTLKIRSSDPTSAKKMYPPYSEVAMGVTITFIIVLMSHHH